MTPAESLASLTLSVNGKGIGQVYDKACGFGYIYPGSITRMIRVVYFPDKHTFQTRAIWAISRNQPLLKDIPNVSSGYLQGLW
jgi:hypothetical protein